MTPEHLESDSLDSTIKKLLFGYQICSQYITKSQESADRISKDLGVVPWSQNQNGQTGTEIVVVKVMIR